MGIDLAPLLYCALAMQLLTGLVCLVVGYFLVKATWCCVEPHVVSQGTRGKQQHLKSKVHFSHQPDKA